MVGPPQEEYAARWHDIFHHIQDEKRPSLGSPLSANLPPDVAVAPGKGFGSPRNGVAHAAPSAAPNHSAAALSTAIPSEWPFKV